MNPLLNFFFLLMLCSCGYHFRREENQPTVSIKSFSSDIEGHLNAALIKSITSTGMYRYVKNGADVIIQIAIQNSTSSPIGYEYSPNHINLFAIENRTSLTAEVSLIDGNTLEMLRPPFLVSATVEFDYANVDALSALSVVTPSGKLEPLVKYSLGQFDSIEGSQEDATLALYKILAQKVTSSLLALPQN